MIKVRTTEHCHILSLNGLRYVIHRDKVARAVTLGRSGYRTECQD